MPMGMGAAYKAGRVLRNAQRVVAAELLCGVQGIALLKPLQPGRGVRWLEERIRGLRDPAIEPLDADHPPSPELERLARAVGEGALDPAAILDLA